MDKEASANYSRIFHKIEELLTKDTPSIVAIDGMCGSGKTYLASLLAENYECNVFHMDDYFLPLEMRTEERLAKPGGNIHYERFGEEVLEPLRKGQAVTWRPYHCGLGKFGENNTVEPKKLTIIEGSYSLHPNLRDAYDLKIFLSVDRKVQLERILLRCGEEKLQQFISRWIPLENLYFDKLMIQTFCDILLDTSRF